MERLILKELLNWKNSPYRKPLILKGVCQVGKTWIREFDSCIIKIVRAGRIKPVLFLSSFSIYYLVIFSDM